MSFGRVFDDAKDFLNSEGDNFYGYVQPVIDLLLPTHDVHFVTGEPQFVGLAVKSKYPSVQVHTSKLEVSDGLFSGGVESLLAYRNEKKKVIGEIMQSHSREDSFAFGDSDGDIEMLSSVEHPICISPTGELKKLAEKRGWIITSPDRVENIVRNLIKPIRT